MTKLKSFQLLISASCATIFFKIIFKNTYIPELLVLITHCLIEFFFLTYLERNETGEKTLRNDDPLGEIVPTEQT